jgi:hypothetical protein
MSSPVAPASSRARDRGRARVRARDRGRARVRADGLMGTDFRSTFEGLAPAVTM